VNECLPSRLHQCYCTKSPTTSLLHVSHRSSMCCLHCGLPAVITRSSYMHPLVLAVLCLIKIPHNCPLFPYIHSIVPLSSLHHIPLRFSVLDAVQLSDARAAPPHCFVDSSPHCSLIPLPINPACPHIVAQHQQDISAPRTCDLDHFETENSSPLSYKHHTQPHNATTSVTHTSTVSRSIGPIFYSIDASPCSSPVNPDDRKSDHGNIVNEPSIVTAHHNHPMPCAASISHPISPPCRTTNRCSCRYRSSSCTRQSDYNSSVSEPISSTTPLP